MAQFIKTFIICLILAFGFLGYRYFGENSYNKDLSTGENPVFGVQKKEIEPQKEQITTNKSQPVEENKSIEDNKVPPQKYIHTCYFFSQNGTLIPTKREVSVKPELEGAILILLKGPTIKESQKGIYSEIPSNVNLINIKRNNNSIIINLTSAFGEGGGSQSIENRIKQLTKTVKTIEPKKNIYLYIDGKQVEYLGGEGVYIKQPLN